MGNTACRALTICALSGSTPASTLRVLTTLSLAMTPVSTAVDASTVPKPAGVNTGAMAPAITPSMLCAISGAGERVKVKCCKNHTTMVARKMTVKARFKKSLALSHSCRATLRGAGRR